VGIYVGKVLGTAGPAGRALMRGSQSNKIVKIWATPSVPAHGSEIVELVAVFVNGAEPPQDNRTQRARAGTVVFDTTLETVSYPVAYIHMANDPRNTGLKANAELQFDGKSVATQNIPEYNGVDKLQSEVLWEYGEVFWDEFESDCSSVEMFETEEEINARNSEFETGMR
jgi:hypothetical protein